MARTIEQKAQMEFIKDPEKVAVIDAGTHIVISFGDRGVYIEKDSALIRYERYLRFNERTGEIHQDENVFPKTIMERTYPAVITDRLVYTEEKDIAVKLVADNGAYAYITIDNLSYFGASCIFRVENETKPVCVTKNGNVVGVIIPEEIQEKDDE